MTQEEKQQTLVEFGEKFFDWARNHGRCRPIGVYHRLHAMVYVWSPHLVSNRSIPQVAKSLGITERSFRGHVLSFERYFKIRWRSKYRSNGTVLAARRVPQ
jgi:hypothetical protein